MTRTPVESGSQTGRRPSAAGGDLSTGTETPAIGALAVERSAETVDHAPEQRVDARTSSGEPVDSTSSSGPTPAELTEREDDGLPLLEADDLAEERFTLAADENHVADAGARQRRAQGKTDHRAHFAHGEHGRRRRQSRFHFLEIHRARAMLANRQPTARKGSPALRSGS